MSKDLPTETCSSENKGGEKILVVDDEDTILRMAKTMLEIWSYEVETFSSPIDALGSFRKNPEKFDLVITDLLMPGMNGRKLAAEIRKIRAEIPIIFSTGTPYEVKSSSETVLAKPFLMKVLQNTIREALDAVVKKKFP